MQLDPERVVFVILDLVASPVYPAVTRIYVVHVQHAVRIGEGALRVDNG